MYPNIERFLSSEYYLFIEYNEEANKFIADVNKESIIHKDEGISITDALENLDESLESLIP